MKKKTVLIILSTVLIMLVVSLGYAAWTITRNTTDSDNGNFQAYGVTDSGNIEVNIVHPQNDDNYNKVVFGKPSSGTPNPNNNWLGIDPSDEEDHLVIKVKVDYSNFDGLSGQVFDINYVMGYVATDNVTGEKSITGSDILASSDYFTLTVTTEAATNATVNQATNPTSITFNGTNVTEGTITLIYTYAWNLPSAFDGTRKDGTNTAITRSTNPFIAYNELTRTNAVVEEAYNYLSALDSQLAASNGKPFGFIVTISEHTN